MRVPRIHTDAPLTGGSSIELDEKAARHVVRVLRMQPGQSLVLFNGDGMDYPATLSTVDKKRATAKLAEPQANHLESPLCIVLGQALARGDRMDYAVQKSVEAGVSVIVPLVTERCELKLRGEREDKRLRHWQSVAISAAEQCGRAVVPEVMPVMAVAQWLDYTRSCDARLVLHHRTRQPLQNLEKPASLALMIGPEGGLSNGEIAASEQAGFLATALGPRVMRTETAPVAAITLCQWLWGDLRQ
ncbi:MAG: 16S rRNA (uracil(1498)-N(3))-methyltransferase [Pseudomonadota bacterium]|nr:16S rRNA (uracil(1498)-N(3))-methyltransferase [Pseudomonadota bacterium]